MCWVQFLLPCKQGDAQRLHALPDWTCRQPAPGQNKVALLLMTGLWGAGVSLRWLPGQEWGYIPLESVGDKAGCVVTKH